MARAPLQTKTTFEARTGAPIRIAAVADTHSSPHPRLGEHLRALEPDAILHAGDIGDLTVTDGLAKIAPLFAVRGNIDVRAPNLPDALTVDLVQEGACALRVFVVHIGLNGMTLRAEVAGQARAEQAGLVVCGHSHVPFAGLDRGIGVFNPGSAGPRRFRLPVVFGWIEVTRQGVSLSHRDCETGQTWSPTTGARAIRA